MAALRRDSAVLPPGRFAEVRYEALRRQPMHEIGRVHDLLGLDLSAPSGRAMAEALRAARPHVPSRAGPDAPVLDWLRRHPEVFRHWNYALPDPPGAAQAHRRAEAAPPPAPPRAVPRQPTESVRDRP